LGSPFSMERAVRSMFQPFELFVVRESEAPLGIRSAWAKPAVSLA